MILYTGMGWVVALIWIGAMAAAGEVPHELISRYGMGISRAGGVLMLAGLISAPVLFIVGSVLNRVKVRRTILRYGKDRTVNWGVHTFYMFPIEFWAIIIPAITLLFHAVFSFV